MATSSEGWAQSLLSPTPIGLAIAILVALTIPLFLHFFVFRASGLTTLPSILLLGASESGKTSLLTLFERGEPADTHTSQTQLAVECSLPVGTSAASSRYRSANDPSNQVHKKFLLIDTPGHGKLRQFALDGITSPANLRGAVFVVDAAGLSAGGECLRVTAEYLHDVLLLLQKRRKTSKRTDEDFAVLIAANKLDLFTALPAALVKSALEAEISKIRTTKSRGLLDSGIGMGDDAADVGGGDQDEWLGEVGDGPFKFAQMEEFNVLVETAGGNVLGAEGPNVEKWWKWVGERL